jgi:hypothetical protein
MRRWNGGGDALPLSLHQVRKKKIPFKALTLSFLVACVYPTKGVPVVMKSFTVCEPITQDLAYLSDVPILGVWVIHQDDHFANPRLHANLVSRRRWLQIRWIVPRGMPILLEDDHPRVSLQ